MSVNEQFTFSCYEVLQNEIHKYATTSVSGGGGYIGQQGGKINDVKTTVHYHSDQEIWVRNIEDKKERKFYFSSFNLDVMDGHKLVVAYDNAGELTKVTNLNTDASQLVDKKTREIVSKVTFLENLGTFFFIGIICGMATFIPFFGGATLGYAFLSEAIKDRNFMTGIKVKGSRKDNLISFALAVLAIFVDITLFNSTDPMGNLGSYIFIKLVIFGFMFFFITKSFLAARNFIFQKITALDKALSEYVEVCKSKELAS